MTLPPCLSKQKAGIVLTDMQLMTGLPEYRNGGLLLDMGLLEAKHPEVTAEAHTPEDEVIPIKTVYVSGVVTSPSILCSACIASSDSRTM